VKPDRVVFNALITACGQSGAVERAFDVLAEMRAEAQPMDPDHVTVGALIRACMSAGQVSYLLYCVTYEDMTIVLFAYSFPCKSIFLAYYRLIG